MNEIELTKLVARIQAGDNRTVDKVTLAHFRETIGHLPFDDCYQAVVDHFRESTDYLKAADINRRARLIGMIRDDRAKQEQLRQQRELDDRERNEGWVKHLETKGVALVDYFEHSDANDIDWLEQHDLRRVRIDDDYRVNVLQLAAPESPTGRWWQTTPTQVVEGW